MDQWPVIKDTMSTKYNNILFTDLLSRFVNENPGLDLPDNKSILYGLVTALGWGLKISNNTDTKWWYNIDSITQLV